MNKITHKILVFGLLLVFAFHTSAQKIDAFARVSVSPLEGVVRQPYKVTITVYSGTWFAEPLRFANLQIDDAFIIPFTRTVSGINYINNKKYASLTFYYLILPYEIGNLAIPELQINASIPPEGDYKGQPTTIRTQSQTIKINPVPSSKEEKVWMVAKNVTVKESWNKPLDKLKVGDVIEREITITASGTLPSLIEPLDIEKPETTSVYPSEPDLQDKRNEQDVNGVRVEKYSYLFEEEGEVIIPAEEIVWWNPQDKRTYKRTIQGQKLSIAPNPDMTLMESLKDSLLAMTAPTETEITEKSFPWMKIIFYIVLLFLLYLLFKLIMKVVQNLKEKQAACRQSEAFYYKRLVMALNQKNSKEIVRELYIWFDKARNAQQSIQINTFLTAEETKLLETLILNIQEMTTDGQKKQLELLLKKLRNQVLNPQTLKPHVQLNPV